MESSHPWAGNGCFGSEKYGFIAGGIIPRSFFEETIPEYTG
jgi:hypothetical protein